MRVFFAISALLFSCVSCGVIGTGSSGSFLGTLDAGFDVGTGFDGSVDRLLLQDDGSILAAGRMTTYKGYSAQSLVKLSSGGLLDSAFNTALSPGISSSVFALTSDSDGNIFIGGSFTSVGSLAFSMIGRLSSGGTPYSLFMPTGSPRGFDDQVNVIVRDAFGRLLVGGEFNTYQGTTAIRLARLDASSGAIDSSYLSQVGGAVNTSPNLVINALLPNSDGSLLVGGNFTLFKLQNRGRLFLLKNDGSEDSDFATQIGTGFDSDVFVIAEDTHSQSYLIGGAFTQFNGRNVPKLVRIGRSGTLDESFLQTVGEGPDSNVRSIVLDSSGNIYVGGDFSEWSGQTANKLVLLDNSGTLDTSFTSKIGTGFNGAVRTMAIQSNGKLIVGGEFTTYQGTSSRKIARIE